MGNGLLLELGTLVALKRIGEVLEALGHGRIEDHVAIGEVDRGAGHAELELVAGEGEGARAVAVGVVLQELGQDGNTEVHGNGFGRMVFLARAHRR